MRLGVIVRADNSGLGIQTRSYYKHLNPEKTMLVDISMLNKMEQHYEWYDDPQIVRGIPTETDIRAFLWGLDVVLTAETPYDYSLYKIAREMGVKTACVPNYEFFDYYLRPDYPKPDLMVLPSMWHYDEMVEWGRKNRVKALYLHHPVDLDEYKFIERKTAKTFHIAGKPATEDRNGTFIYLNTVPDGIVTTQSVKLANMIRQRYPRTRVLNNVQDSASLYHAGDILVLPRRYGGNCLPLNEALASGCPVVMPDIEPNNNLLPQDWLVPAYKDGFFKPRTQIDLYSVDPQKLLEKIEWFKTQNMPEQSRRAYEIAKTISWETLKPKWEQALCGLL